MRFKSADVTVVAVLALVMIVTLSVAFNLRTAEFKAVQPNQRCRLYQRNIQICMGRASFVRAATKSRTDLMKSKNYNKFAKLIINAVKSGGTDPALNRNLAAVMANARAANVPNDVIIRNIDKAMSHSEVFKESLFEFIGPGGCFLLVNVHSDNDNRASSDVLHIGRKHSLKAGTMGSIAHYFNQKARIDVSAVVSEDSLMEICLNGGVDDYSLLCKDENKAVDSCNHKSTIFVEVAHLAYLRDSFRNLGFNVEASIRYVPKDGYLRLSASHYDSFLDVTSAFLELGDVDSVEHNVDTSL